MPVIVKSETPTSEKDFWRTPSGLFAYCNARWGPYTLDAAADETNHLCRYWFGPGGVVEDALAPDVVWGARNWCNPPYSRGMVRAFMRKAVEQAENVGALTTLLVPATTDAPWWHDWVWGIEGTRAGVEVEFLRGRVRFNRPDGTPAGTPTFASVLVTFCGAK